MRSLRFKFIAYVAALLTVLLLLLNTYPLISARDAVYQEKKNSMSGQAAVVASSLSSLDRLSREGVAEVLRFLEISGFDRITVADGAGDIVYDSGEAGQAAGEDLSLALSGKIVFRSILADGAFSSSVTVPMGAQGAISGAVYLHEYDTDRAEIILSIQGRIRALSIVIGVIALLTALVFSFLIMRRLRALVSSMRNVAAGDYGYRHPVRGGDEISELGQEFNLLTERLEATEEQRRRFVSDASHELRTPLASIRLLADSIVQNESMSPETTREFVTDIGNEAQRLQRTAEKLLSLSRLDDGVQAAAVPVDLKQVSLDALVFLRPLAKERQVHLRCQLEEGCVVMGTVDGLYQIIFNLVENAIKYNVPDGGVDLTLRGTEDKILLRVEDTGIGIPEEDRPNVFSRFYRVDKARSREDGGSGLGLSIVLDTVRSLGGSIEVGQNSPRGTVFTVELPRPTSEETGI